MQRQSKLISTLFIDCDIITCLLSWQMACKQANVFHSREMLYITMRMLLYIGIYLCVNLGN